MKKQTHALILASFIFFLFNPTFAAESPPNTRPPDIQFEETAYDFGVAGQKEEVVHGFRFKNVGGKTLSIKGMRSSCGCVAESVSKKSIPPGESGVITVVFQTRKYHGEHTKSVFVETNDPDEPEVELSISGMIKTEVAVVPQFVFFGDVEKGNLITKEIKLIQIGDEKLRLEKAEPSSKYLTARISRLIDDRNQGFTISVSLGTDMPVGKFAEVITLYTNLKRHGKIDVPIAGNILGRIRVNPRMLSLGAVKKGEMASRKLKVKAAEGNDFEILNTDTTCPFVSVEVGKLGKAGGYEIALTIAEQAPVGKFSGEVEIYTDNPDQELIRVPFYGLIEK